MVVSVPVCISMEKTEGPISPCHIFFLSSKSFTIGQLLSGNNIKPKRNTFFVIFEPHLLVVITRAYVSGFYIHITSSGLYIHSRESSQAKRHFTKDNMNGRGSSVHIYNIKKKKNVSRLINKARWM